MILRQLAIVCLVCLPSPFAFTQQEACKLMLQDGLYKLYEFHRTGNFSTDIKSYLQSDQFRSDFKDKKWNGSISAIVDAAPVKLGGGASDSEISVFQHRVREAHSFSLDQNFYEYAKTAIPDVELAKTYADCLVRMANVTQGFDVTTNVSERQVFFVITYRNRISSDAMPVVTLFVVNNPKQINCRQSFSLKSVLKNENTVACPRNPDQELSLVLETSRGIATSRIPANPSGFNKDLPVGTVIASYLDWPHFQSVTRNNAGNPAGDVWSARFSKWAPADNRAVPNSAFERAANVQRVPDLRGVFIRGLNIFDRDEGPQVDSKRADPTPHRVVGDYEADGFASHKHGGGDHTHQTGTFQGAHLDNDAPAFRTSASDSNHPKQHDFPQDIDFSGEVIKAEGGPETRPKNVSLYYYIRIN